MLKSKLQKSKSNKTAKGKKKGHGSSTRHQIHRPDHAQEFSILFLIFHFGLSFSLFCFVMSLVTHRFRGLWGIYHALFIKIP